MEYALNKSVPFEIPDVNHGLQVAKGILKLRENGVELEFAIKDAFLGIINSGLKTKYIDFEDLQSIRFDRGWFNAEIVLEAVSMQVLTDMPGSEQASCALKVKRRHRKEAEEVVSTARMLLSEHKLNRLD